MESIGGDLRAMSPQPFNKENLAAIRAISTERGYEPGEFVVNVGDPMNRFILVLDGEIEVADPFTGERLIPSTLRAGQFSGELSFLNAGSATLPMRAAEPTRTLEAPREAMLELMARVPELGDHVLTVFAARRRFQVEQGRSALTVIGAEGDPAVQRVASFLSRNRVPYRSFALDEKSEETAAICQVSGHRPAVIAGKDRIIEEPTPGKIARFLGLDFDTHDTEQLDLLIVGAGPAGVAAAVYAGSEGLKALVVEDTAIGGQAGTSSRIENFMGFPTGISGADLVYRGEVQAMKFGTRFVMPRRVVHLAETGDGFCVTLEGGDTLCARAILVATGVQYRRLPIERMEALEGSGIYYAATEMEARFCRDTEAAVIGGGNSAGQAAMFLSRAARHVHVLVRGGELTSTMSAYLRERLESDPRITIHYHTELATLDGDDRLAGISVRNRAGEMPLPCSALFVMIGAAPNTDWLSGLVNLDERGFVRTGRDVGGRSSYETSRRGIFAVGDVRAGSVKRVASSVGEGSVVVSAIWSHVNASHQT